jgi:hypothetical protein
MNDFNLILILRMVGLEMSPFGWLRDETLRRIRNETLRMPGFELKWNLEMKNIFFIYQTYSKNR